MINFDTILLDFIEHNSVTLLLVFGFLKVLAGHSKSTLDDSIIDYLTSFFSRSPKEIKAQIEALNKELENKENDTCI